METQHARRLVEAAERIAAAQERIAAALEAANKADPLQMIAEAMAMEENKAVNVDESIMGVWENGKMVEPEAWRLK